PAPPGAAGIRVRLRPGGGSTPAVLRQRRTAAGRRRVARPVPPLLDTAVGGAGHRTGPRAAGTTHARSGTRQLDRGEVVINIEEQINAVHRQVGTRQIEAGEARTVVISQTYRASVDDVWDACTSAERIPRWFLPVSGDLRVGGKYQLEGN